MDSDDELLVGLQAGDEAAFAALVHRYHWRFVRSAEAALGSRAVAEEAVQDTWIAVLRGIQRFEGRASLRTWLFHVLANRVRTAARREVRSGARHDELDPARIEPVARGAEPEQWTDDADDRVLAAQLAGRIRQLIAALPHSERQVVELRDLQGLPPREVATRAGVTDGYQRVLLHRGHVRLRQLLSSQL